jgi:hypothetical protein
VASCEDNVYHKGNWKRRAVAFVAESFFNRGHRQGILLSEHGCTNQGGDVLPTVGATIFEVEVEVD